MAATTATASGIGGVDPQTAAQGSDRGHNDRELSQCRFCHVEDLTQQSRLDTLTVRIAAVGAS
jgi:hypothetical protein